MSSATEETEYTQSYTTTANMATLEYLEIPVGATRLRASPDAKQSHDIRPALQITTSLPNPSPPSSPTLAKRKPSMLSSTAASLASPAVSLFPQLLLSATLPPMTPNTPSAQTTSNPRKKVEQDRPMLLSSKDPLSLPIMTVNFKRFIMIIGPAFWLQDRVEEIILWKRGWLRTTVWMAAYAFICFYPRVLFLLPHVILISAILATYPYPTKPSSDPLSSSAQVPPTAPPAEGSVPWQANIQGIQNLMGATADLHAIIEPYLYHFYLTPAHLSSSRQRTTSSSQPSTPIRSPYTPHILSLLVLSFFPFLFLVHLPWFPIREACIFIGLAPFFVTHPYVRALLPLLVPTLVEISPVLLLRLKEAKSRVMGVLGYQARSAFFTGGSAEENEPPLPFSMILQRVMDDDRLNDECWNAEMREVELWENERYGGSTSSDTSSMHVSSSSSSVPPPPHKGWSKQNLRPGDRAAWTRGRDGWSGIGVGGTGSGVDVSGEVSSNLTFSLAPGWLFVESEDWRKDLQCAWSGCGGDPDGWVYTNDAWLDSQPAPFTSGTGSLTRRRRWVRRVYYDPKRASSDS